MTQSTDRIPVKDDRMMAALDVLSDGICYFDERDRVLFFNRAFSKLYGSLSKVLKPGASFRQIVLAGLDVGLWDLHDLDRDEWLARVLARRREPSSQSTFRFSDGRWFMYRDQRTDDGGRIGIITEITDIKAGEAKIAAANALHRQALADLTLILDELPIGVILLDTEFKVEIINSTCAQLWGIENVAPHIGREFGDLVSRKRMKIAPDMGDEEWETYLASRVAEVRAGSLAPRQFRRSDGSTVVYAVIDLASGKRLVTYYDVTEMTDREAELELALEQALLAESVVNGLSDAVFVKDADMRYVMVNHAFARLTNRSPEDIVGKQASDLNSTEKSAHYDRLDREVMATGVGYEGDDEMMVDGHVVSQIARTMPIRLLGGKNYVAGFLFDVTEMRRHEREVEQSRRYLVNVLEMLPAAVIIYDRDDHFVFANRMLQASMPAIRDAWHPDKTFRDAFELGRSSGYFRSSGDVKVDALYETDGEMWLNAILARSRQGFSTYERLSHDGRWWKVYDMRTDDGMFIGVRVDISEMKAREEALREAVRQQDLYRQVFDELPVALTIKSKDLAIEVVNRTWQSITGISQEEAVGRTDEEIFPSAEGQSFNADNLRVRDTGVSCKVEEVVTHRDGTVRALMTRKNRLGDRWIRASLQHEHRYYGYQVAGETTSRGAEASRACRSCQVGVSGKYEP